MSVKKYYNIAKNNLYPICRSITGQGTFKTLKIIKNSLPNLKIKKTSERRGGLTTATTTTTEARAGVRSRSGRAAPSLGQNKHKHNKINPHHSYPRVRGFS